MAGYRGYSNYRGRKSTAKAAATVLLILVILAAVVVMLLQRHIVYDETGMPHLEIPWQKEEAKEEEPPDMGKLDLTLDQQPEEETLVRRGYAAPAGVLTVAAWEELQGTLAAQGLVYNAVAVTLKDHAGDVYFDSGVALTRAVKTEADTAAVLAEITALPQDTIARIACFHDPRIANADVEGMGLKNTGGYIFYDGNNSQWLDPSKPAARRYLCDLAEEAALLGFDEIMLTDVSYPTEGKLDKVDYGTAAKTDNMETFLREMRAVLEPHGVALSVEVPASVLTEGRDDVSGLTLTGVAEFADRIYAAVTPEIAADCAAAAEMEVDIVPLLATYDPAATGNCLVLG
ncbi:MAG: hypothetical protein IKU81_07480 [Oscillibacter sp.]|nr:hypothetical protein [Oscillibacter sp.]